MTRESDYKAAVAAYLEIAYRKPSVTRAELDEATEKFKTAFLTYIESGGP